MPALKLYLCRHAEAVDAPDASSDEDRWLTAKGRRQAHRVGKALRQEGERPDVVLMSPLVRAVQTAEGLAQALDFEEALVIERALAPGGGLPELLGALAVAGAGARALFVVGHEPMMSGWAATLLGARFPRAFSKGAVLRLDFTAVPEPGGARAKFFLTPERLEREKL